MDREGFRNRLKQYKLAREENPGLKYWEWKNIPKYDEGGKVIPTQEEYIAEQIAARKAAALEKSLSRTMPRVPQGIKTGERWNPVTKKVEDIHECGPSCAYTFSDNYGLNWMGSEDFKQNHANYGWKQVPWEQRQPGNAVLIVDDSGTAKHTMMYDSDNAQGQPLFNHSNGGHDESAIRKKAKYPHHNPYLTYEFVGTPADSTQWINDYKKIYGFAEGGEVEPDPLEILERSRPKVAGIPINDKPLSGTDPLGELYLNLVSGHAIRKEMTRGINGMVRKSFYDNYKSLLKAGFDKQRAYNYASPELAIGVLPGIAKGFDYVIRGANYMHAAEDFIEQ